MTPISKKEDILEEIKRHDPCNYDFSIAEWRGGFVGVASRRSDKDENYVYVQHPPGHPHWVDMNSFPMGELHYPNPEPDFSLEEILAAQELMAAGTNNGL